MERASYSPAIPIHRFAPFGPGIAVHWVGTGLLLSALIKKKQEVLGGQQLIFFFSFLLFFLIIHECAKQDC